MSLLLVPYTNAMRLGQGFNSYTQQICVDDAVVIDNERAENILLNDGSTMRILTQSTGKASAWTRQREVVVDDRTIGIPKLLPEPEPVKSVATPTTKVTKQLGTTELIKETSVADKKGESSIESTKKSSTPEDTAEDTNVTITADAQDETKESSESQEPLVAKESAPPPVGKAEPVSTEDESLAARRKLEADTVAHKAAKLQAEKEDQDALRQAEKERLAAQREYQEEVERESREEDRKRREEERDEQREMRREKRLFEQERRKDMYKSIKEASSSKSTALSIQEMQNILKQNQFAERWNGMAENNENIVFDKNAPRGPSQTVTYTSRFIDRLSDITDDMCISGALSIKAAKIGGSGRGSFVDSDKFKESDLTFYISVKVINQTINFKDALQFKNINGLSGDKFSKVFGDSFISGFLEGGEFNAVVSMKILNKAKKTDIQAEAKVAFTTGPMSVQAEANIGIARENLESNTETTIQVSWCGGGHIKPMEQQWDIKSLMAAAARFPDLVADCPQRTYAILTKYDTLRSFVIRQPPAYSKLQYENAQIYTNVLMDAFMSYKALYKQISDQMFQVKQKALEILPWNPETPPALPKGEKDEEKNDKKDAKKDERKETSGFLPYIEDNTRFEASILGLDQARKAIRRQMSRIVNEVDAIEADPTLATNENHEETFQLPTSFEMRLPAVEVPIELRSKLMPLTGQRIIAATQTEEERLAEAKKQAALAQAPPLYDKDEDMQSYEAEAFGEYVKADPSIGHNLRATGAVGDASFGDSFNNLDFVRKDWHIKYVRVKYAEGMIATIEVEYDNGLVVYRGMAITSADRESLIQLGPFESQERIVAGSIQTGIWRGGNHHCILSLKLYTNRGGKLVADAKDIKKGDKEGDVVRDTYTYHTIKTTHIDCPLNKGTLKGFFGRSLSTHGVRRLGFIWGDILQ